MVTIFHSLDPLDCQAAERLKQGIETISIPKDYRSKRDSLDVHLVTFSSDQPIALLASSNSTIVVASTSLVRNPRADLLIDAVFKENDSHSFLCWLNSDVQENCLPHALQKRGTPLASNPKTRFGENKSWRHRIEVLRILSSLLGCEFEQLRQRIVEQTRRRQRAALTVSLLGLAIAASLSYYALRSRSTSLQSQEDATQSLASASEARDIAVSAALDMAEQELQSGTDLPGNDHPDVKTHIRYATLDDFLSRYEQTNISIEGLRLRLKSKRVVGDSYARSENIDHALNCYFDTIRIFEDARKEQIVPYSIAREAVIARSRIADMVLGISHSSKAARGTTFDFDKNRFGNNDSWKWSNIVSPHQYAPYWKIEFTKSELDCALENISKALDIITSFSDESEIQLEIDRAFLYVRRGDIYFHLADKDNSAQDLDEAISQLERVLSRDRIEPVRQWEAAVIHAKAIGTQYSLAYWTQEVKDLWKTFHQFDEIIEQARIFESAIVEENSQETNLDELEVNSFLKRDIPSDISVRKRNQKLIDSHNERNRRMDEKRTAKSSAFMASPNYWTEAWMLHDGFGIKEGRCTLQQILDAPVEFDSLQTPSSKIWADQKWEDAENWDALETGMSESEVISTLGKPWREAVYTDAYRFLYQRGYGAEVRFSKNKKVLSWNLPRKVE